MITKRMPRTDLDVSVIGLGTWVFAEGNWGGVRRNDVFRVIDTAFDNGVNFIDTAPSYGFGGVEELVGKAIKGRRDKFIVTTKCGVSWNEERDVLYRSSRNEAWNRTRFESQAVGHGLYRYLHDPLA